MRKEKLNEYNLGLNFDGGFQSSKLICFFFFYGIEKFKATNLKLRLSKRFNGYGLHFRNITLRFVNSAYLVKLT